MLPDFPIIITDESVDGRITKFLQEIEYSVISIAKMHPGISDEAVINVALQHNGFIITEDKDFGDELIYKAPHLKVPTLLLRLSGISIDEKLLRITDVLNIHTHELIVSFSVLSPNKLRLRRFE